MTMKASSLFLFLYQVSAKIPTKIICPSFSLFSIVDLSCIMISLILWKLAKKAEFRDVDEYNKAKQDSM